MRKLPSLNISFLFNFPIPNFCRIRVSCLRAMSDYLPREIWSEILYRQTPKSLVKCTSVCKQWKSLITDPSFIFEHISRQTSYGNQRLLLWLCRKSESKLTESFSLRLDAGKLDLLTPFEYPFRDRFSNRCSHVVGTCNGLVCLADCGRYHGCNFFLWNPTIRKYVVIPTPVITFHHYYSNDECCLGFGFDSKNNDFKVVVVIPNLDGAEGPARVGVYSLARGSWKRILREAPLFNLSWISYDTSLCPRCNYEINNAFLNGVLHWVVWQTKTSCSYILTFDVAEETFGELMLPKSLNEPKHLESLVSVLRGGQTLTVVQSSVPLFSKQWFNIWVMKEYGAVESWTKVFSYESDIGAGLNLSRPLCFRNCGELLLQNPSGEIIAADPVKKKRKCLGIMGDGFAFVGYQAEGLVLLDKKTNVLSY